MKPDLRITLIQTSLHWENREANLEMMDEKISSFQNPTDLILLPEMFTTGFSMQPEKFAEAMDGVAMRWMRENAQKKNAVICGSMMMRAPSPLKREGGEAYFNRLIWMKPDGTFEQYDKRHLFGLGEENLHYTKGEKKILPEVKGWKILPLVCYDLRFPVWSRNTPSNSALKKGGEPALSYDVLIYIANWPEKRIAAWKTLLEARAIENQAYVIGVNCVGHDGNEMHHPGASSVIDPKGEILWRESDIECIHHVTLSYHHLNHIRESFPFLKDADEFEIKT
ncbi:MAG: amidohydrolase [Chitinophagales bacterium]|nr:amidohydrolase [Chitinophagales bacterium]